MKKKYLIISLISIASILIILFLLKSIFTKNQESDVTYRVEKEIYENVIEISGTVSAAQQQTLQALSAGTVMKVYVKAGDKVKKGDVILQLDDTEQVYNLAKHDYTITTTKISGSQKELDLLQTQRLSLVQKIADRKVVATFDGIIADLDVSEGDSLEAKDTVGTLVNVDYLTAEVEIAETDVGKLKIGQKVSFTFPACSGKTIEGYVTGWPTIGEVTSRGATIVKAKVRIDDYPEEILPNFSFTGKIEISPTQENLVVERYAVAYEDKSPYVVLAKTGEKRYVKVQPYGRNYVKITEGLSGGEVLKQLTVPKQSGTARNQGNQNKDNNQQNKNKSSQDSGFPGGPDGGGPGPGGGGPGPGGF